MEISNETMIVRGVYRSPSGIEPLFLDFYEPLIDNDYITGSNAILTGGLKQIIRHPTRCTKTSRTLVDHLYTNIAYSKETKREYGMISHHEVIGTELRTSTETKKSFIIRRDFSEKDK
ncbi:hypothetical protein HHI36_012503 [Cryptolaemus montrouzieri]|uniref:Uncharacterized protein n=1 Tax=Cryptolaemus montrouzieri TaxID=559131 RepID=A0ABD2NF54_9CUCU